MLIMKKINLQNKLTEHRDDTTSGDALLQDIREILAEDDAKEQDIQDRILNGLEIEEVSNAFDLDVIETNRIFHLDQIKQMSTVYRLRFLNSNLFKKGLPYEAIQKIKHLEKQHQTTLSGFKILAPAEAFRLKNADDPLLFAPIGNGYYYLIHKWGNDLSPWRKILVWPWRNLECMIGTLMLLSIVLSALFPTSLFTDDLTAPQFLIVVFFMFKWLAGLSLFFFFKKGKNFSPAVWKSKYFNA